MSNIEERGQSYPAVSAATPEAVAFLGRHRSSAGVYVDRLTALSIPSVWRSVCLIAQKVARLDLGVYKRAKDGGKTEDTAHPAHWVLSRKPSQLYTPFVYRMTQVSQVLLNGNSFSLIIRNEGTNAPEELILLNPECTGIAIDGNQLYYWSRMGKEVRKFLPDNILHIKGLTDQSGLIGLSVLDVLCENLGLGQAITKYQSVWFRNNGSPGPMILKFPSKLDKETIDKLREDWDKMHLGIENSNRYAILANGGELIPWSTNNDSAQLVEMQEQQVALGVANIFGLPASKLNVKGVGSYGTLQEENLSFLHDCFDGILTNYEEECESKLLKESQKIRDSHSIQFDRTSLEQADYTQKVTNLIALLNNGVITDEEAREEMNRAALPDSVARRVPTNIAYVIPADQTAAPDDDPVSVEEYPSDAPEDDQGEPLRSLLASVISRWVRRCQKAALVASKREDWTDWLVNGLPAHRAILSDSIAPVCHDADQRADAILKELREELGSVTRDQVGKVFGRIRPEALAERVLACGRKI